MLLPILPGTLPPNACYESEQERLNAFSANQNAVLSGATFYNYGSDKPDPQYQSFPWLRTTDMRWYRYSGVWLSPNPAQPGDHRWEVFATEADVWDYDGGDGSDPSIVTPSANGGAMWEVDHDFDGRSPMSPGEISGSDPTKTLAPEENYGAGSITLTLANLPPHHHEVKYSTDDSGEGFPAASNGDTEDFSYNTEDTGGNGEDPAEATPINNVHPVRGMFCIKRTARINYVVP